MKKIYSNKGNIPHCIAYPTNDVNTSPDHWQVVVTVLTVHMITTNLN